MEGLYIVHILGTAVLGNMLAHWYEPIQKPKRWAIRSVTFFPLLSRTMDRVLNCSKCTSFLLGLVIFRDVLTAALIAFIGYVIGWVIDKINSWYE